MLRLSWQDEYKEAFFKFLCVENESDYGIETGTRPPLKHSKAFSVMVNHGPSTGCGTCRTSKVKVSLTSIPGVE